MKKIFSYSIFFFCFYQIFAQENLTISKEKLHDKIKGGWAGQTIGVTLGGPHEFKYNGSFMQDYQPIVWYDGYIKNTMVYNSGLYDDLYMDLTFVDVFEKYGLNAPVDSFAQCICPCRLPFMACQPGCTL